MVKTYSTPNGYSSQAMADAERWLADWLATEQVEGADEVAIHFEHDSIVVEMPDYAEQSEAAAAARQRAVSKVNRYVQQYGGYLSGDMVVLSVPLSMAQVEETFDHFRGDNLHMVDSWKKEQP